MTKKVKVKEVCRRSGCERKVFKRHLCKEHYKERCVQEREAYHDLHPGAKRYDVGSYYWRVA